MRRVSGSVRGFLMLGAGAALLAMAGSAQADGGFMDTRINFTITDENLLVKPGETNPSVPGLRIGPPSSLGTLFFDNYDTRFSGYENLSHLVLYKKSMKGKWDAEGAFVLRMNEFSDVNISVSDAGSYVRVAWFPDRTGPVAKGEKGPTDNFSLTAFPMSGDRFRLGYSYRISWGGSPVFFKLNPDIPVGTSSFVTNTTPAPGLRAQWSTDKLYAFAGFKTSTLLDPKSNEVEAVYGAMLGGGYDVTPELRVEANGGFFDRGGSPKQEILGEGVQLVGGSAQVSYHVGMPVGSSVDYQLYRNEPESVARMFKKESYPGGTSYLVAAEGTFLAQTLQDPERPASTVRQNALAADLNFRMKKCFTRFKADFLVRDLAFILHNVPSFVPFQDFSEESEQTVNLFASAGFDHYFEDMGLTLGFTGGVEIPATYAAASGPTGAAPTGDGTKVVVRGEGNFSILPPGEDVVPVFAGKLNAKLEIAESFATLLDVYFSNDQNQTRLTRDSSTSPFVRDFVGQPNQLGFNLTLQARF